MVYAQVIVAQRTNVQELTYAVPASIIPYIVVGVMVEVPLRRRLVEGVVISLSRRVSPELRGKVREIASASKEKLGFSAAQIKVIGELAEYYGAGLAEVAYHALSFPQPLPKAIIDPPAALKPTFIQAPFEARQKFYQQLIRKFQTTKRIVFLFATEESSEAFQKYTKSEFTRISSAKRDQKNLAELLKEDQPFLAAGQQGLAFLPLRPGDILVIDQPDHIGGKLQRRPFLRLKRIGLIRAKNEGLKLILGADLLSVDDYPKVAERTWQLQAEPLSKRPLTVYNRARSPFLLLPQIEEEIETALKNRERVLVLASSKGWAPVLYCPACQEVLLCPTCVRPIALTSPNELTCSYCTTKLPRPVNCPRCRSNELVAVGEGVVQIQAALKKRFPEQPFVIVSSLSEVRPAHQPLLVATEKILTYVQEKFELVVLASMDRLLSGTNPSGSWQLLDGLLQLRGRSSQIIVQTHFPEHWVWSAYAAGSLNTYYRAELASRHRYQLPPFGEEVAVVGDGQKISELFKKVEAISNSLTRVLKDVQIGSPEVERRAGQQVHMTLPIYLSRRLKTDEKTILRDSLPPAWHLDIEP